MKTSRLWILTLLLLGAVTAGITVASFASENRDRVPPEKQAYIDRAHAQKEQANQDHSPKQDPGERRPQPEPRSQPTGILSEANPVGRDLLPTNMWQDVVGDDLVQVIAGSLSSDRAQGGVQVITRSQNHAEMKRMELYLTPNRDGAVSVEAVVGHKLVLRGSAGAVFFDVDSRRFS